MEIKKVGELKTCVLISGMHRSGTSCLAGTLQQAGLYLGSVHTKSPHNRKGNRENPAVMQLNDEILLANSATWDQPRVCPSEPTLTTRCQAILDALRRGTVGGHFGLKDPRLLFTHPVWLDALGDAPRAVIFSFRHPLAVAKSLQARNGWDLQRGMALWLAYNRQAISLAEQSAVAWVNFDSPPDRYSQRTRQILDAIGLSSDVEESAPLFYEETLVHHHEQGAHDLPPEVEQTYGRLCRMAELSS